MTGQQSQASDPPMDPEGLGKGLRTGRTVRSEDAILLIATLDWRKGVSFEVLLFGQEQDRFRLCG